jgi:hypothetical protein
MLLADFHHIIVDGTSLNILFDEISKIYDGKDYEIEELDGFEYCLNEIKTRQSGLYEEAKLLFNNRVKEFDDVTLIPQDINGDESQGKVAMNDISLKKPVLMSSVQKQISLRTICSWQQHHLL